MNIRKAEIADLHGIMTLMAQARIAQRKLGFRQWEDDYPSTEIIMDDIESGRGYILYDSSEFPAGYAMIVTNDPRYSCISKYLKLKGDYAVIHRMAISDEYRGKGMCPEFFLLLEKIIKESGINIVRVDTGERNLPMLNTLKKLNYNFIGVLDYVWGPRATFEKML